MEANVLRLLAEDSEELGIVAAAVQDSLVKPEDIKFNKKARTFGLEINRFQWERAGKRPPFFRSRAVLAFAGVETVRSRGVSRDIDAVHDLLDIRFDPAAEPPGGTLTLTFAGKTQIQLAVECIDVTLMDTGTAWPTPRKPDHGKKA
ncbi:MAG TPA: DUF2948 family protein [Hyphomonadaceae bacterium]|jgi:hypothetical protein